ncbi:Txe/YoeB family addiction module toxin [Parabacteroides sp. PF5-6]|uniref:Txe/YoeB family addiction module toxin n=1 Tax=Parabacteroides sp. PF5-6 TaxID=1742403 RepID=UPI002406EF21|nr:Txe/YoeB family addiction module toxin [Parabacteroides sp. PF5-6]MDF9830703.1 toxin YoeB [Parabacteroides sp. PF5-6]
MYTIEITPEADKDLRRLSKNDPAAYKKAKTLINELATHPYFGTGRPKTLTGDLAGYQSRRITDYHRLVYKVIHDKVVVVIISAYGHYGDK